MNPAPSSSAITPNSLAGVIGSSVWFGCFLLTAAALQCQVRGTEIETVNAPSWRIFYARTAGGRPTPRRVNRQEYNTRKGNTASASLCVVETRHLRGVTTTTKIEKMKNETAAPSWGSILRLEDAIYRVSAVADLVISRYLATIPDEDQSPHQSRVFAGIMALESTTFAELEAAFSEVTAYAKHLREQNEIQTK